ncbi:MAG: broad specificity phosphatase PhoE [Limisphaerales bacterium]|jgi:broad specificity phosphatase PhoE
MNKSENTNSEQQIYLVRHGQTDYNLKRIVQGRGVDASLNATGLSQAGKFYSAYKTVPFSHIYTSSLIRTKETAGLFIDSGISHSAHSEIDEIDWGDQEGVKTSPKMRKFYGHVMRAWSSGDYSPKMKDGESPLEVQDRVKTFFNSILNPSLDPVLIVSHGRTMRIILCTLLNKPLSEMRNFEHGNLGLYIVRRAADGFEMTLKNSSKHLEE